MKTSFKRSVIGGRGICAFVDRELSLVDDLFRAQMKGKQYPKQHKRLSLNNIDTRAIKSN